MVPSKRFDCAGKICNRYYCIGFRNNFILSPFAISASSSDNTASGYQG
jgi:hypothetical protein